jgi:tellurite resistance protein TerC
LRSLYFVLAGAIAYFKFLKVGLSFVLVFIGLKMLVDPHADEAADGVAGGPHEGLWFQFEIPIMVSMAVVGGILFISILLSLVHAYRVRSLAGAGEKEGA